MKKEHMTMATILSPFVNGLSQAMLLFLVASGLTLVFGVLRILNFSHGAFFMLGAYIGFSITKGAMIAPWLYFLIVLVAGIIVAVLAAFIELTVLRRIYKVDEIFSLIATFAVLLILQGVVHQIWGAAYLSVNFPKGLGGGVDFLGMTIPLYYLIIIGIGFLVAFLLWVFIQKTSVGTLIRASAEDSIMTNALGVNVPIIYTSVFVISAFLAGIAGLISAPSTVLTPTLAMTFIIQAFGVVVVGGLGSIPGAFLAAIILSLIDSYLTAFVPLLAGVSFFIGMIVILLWKPKGLLAH
jgi:branched-chain amino acid transport system permease protein